MSTEKRVSPGDIVVVNFPFTHGAGAKKRPALVVAGESLPQGSAGDLVTVARITSRDFGRERSERGEVVIRQWSEAGLEHPSQVESRRLVTVQRQNILKVMGRVSDEELTRVRQALIRYLSVHPGLVIGG